jgi:hypothetical protein
VSFRISAITCRDVDGRALLSKTVTPSSPMIKTEFDDVQ